MPGGRRIAGISLAGAGLALLAASVLSLGIQNPVLRLYAVAFAVFLLLGGAFAFLSKGPTRRVVGACLYVLWLAGFLEGGSAVAIRVKAGEWHWTPTDPAIFDPHPWRVGVPHPGVTAEENGKVIHHNSLGLRGREDTLSPPAGRVRLVTLGGSTTYCVGVSEGETWPEDLERQLGPSVDVLNLGVPGYTTVENLIQTALDLSEFHPAVAIYYEGWNDLLGGHVENLRSDYSDFHGLAQFHALNLPEAWTGPDLAFIRLTIAFLHRVGWVPEAGYLAVHVRGDVSQEADARALSLYRRNLQLIVALCRRQGIEPVLVPQVLNADAIRGHLPYGRSRYVPDDAILGLLAGYNRTLEEVADEERVACGKEILDAPWGPADFLDRGHFSPTGARRFAALLAPRVREVVARLGQAAR